MTPVSAEAGDPPHSCDLGGLLEGESLLPYQAEIRIEGLSLDSRKISPGMLFVALPGAKAHGLVHAGEAIQRGCAAILYDPAQGGAELASHLNDVPTIAMPALKQHLGRLADHFYQSPSRALSVIGVTGTNGKTSCTHFMAQALYEDQAAGVIGTLGWGIPPELAPTDHTTPDVIDVHRLLAALKGRGCHSVAMEASSHGQDQGRLDGVRFRGALYTNFTRDHLDYHGDMERYLEAKMGLMDAPGLEFVAINAESPIADAVLARRKPDLDVIAFSTGAVSAYRDLPLLRSTDFSQGDEGLSFEAHFEGQTVSVQAPVFGAFNHENVLATLAVLLGLGYSLTDAATRLARIRPVAGRMERYSLGEGRTVVVDYAHTPDALQKVLQSLRPHCKRQLWVVFGCGGDRDKGKRPEMGAVASMFADQVVLTSDNPRSENEYDIIRDIVRGCGRKTPAIVADRKAAIVTALHFLEAGDWAVIAGKGHEETQEIEGEKLPFSDRAVVRDWMRRRGLS